MQRLNFQLLYTLHGHTDAISSVKFSPCGEFLASSASDKIINIWNVASGEIEASLFGHKEGISEIVWSKDGRLLVSASDDKRLKIWDVKRKECVKTLKGHANFVFCTSFSSNPSNLIASGSDDFTVKVWDVGTGICLNTIFSHSDRIVSVDFNHHISRMLTASHDGFCCIYDMTLQQEILRIPCADPDGILSFAKFSPNGNFILTATLNNTIKLWCLQQRKCIKVYRGHENSKFCLNAGFLDGRYVVSGSEDQSIYIWNLNRQRLVQKVEGHEDVVLCVDCHPTQYIIASGSLEEDKTVKIWRS